MQLMTRLRTLSLIAACLLLAVACGSRVSEEQRAQVAFADQEGAATGATTVTGDTGTAGTDDGGTGSPSTSTSAAAGSTTSQSSTGGSTSSGTSGSSTSSGSSGSGSTSSGSTSGGASSGSSTGGGGSSSASGGSSGGSGTSGGSSGGGGGGSADDAGGSGGGDAGGSGSGGGLDPTQVPPGGNGGATDIGVTETTINIANISDVSGAVPGLFENEQLGASARIAMENAIGPIFGRTLEFQGYDSQLNSGANRAASIEACETAFAAGGSMSAFDQGGAPVIDDCDLPDMRTAATTEQMQAVDNHYAISIGRPDREGLGAFRWVQEQFPGVQRKAAYLYIAGEVTEQSTGKTRRATAQELGWEWVYVQSVDIAETNYAPFVLGMRDAGVEFVTFQGAYQQAVRLGEAMQQQGFEPAVYMLQSNTYDPNTIALGGDAVEGIYIPISSVMVEEIDQHPELQTYAQWLQQVAPGKAPTSLGMYAWSATSLLIEAIKAAGPNLTREAVLEYLSNAEGWDGNGLHPPFDIGARTYRNCFVMTQINGGRFTRQHPSSGFDCDGPIANL